MSKFNTCDVVQNKYGYKYTILKVEEKDYYVICGNNGKCREHFPIEEFDKMMEKV